MSNPHQARCLQKFNEADPTKWQTLPDKLATSGIKTKTGKAYTIQIVNHWKAARRSRPIPAKCIPVIARLYADDADPEGKVLDIEADIRREMSKDGGHHADFWVRADDVLKGLKIIKLVVPPFTSPRRQRAKGRPDREQPFLDFCTDRFLGFSGHRVAVLEEADEAQILEDIVAQRQTTKIGFGLLSSIERLALLEPLHMPIRIGLNAVCLIREESDRKRIAQIRESLLGFPSVTSNTLAMAAKHEVGWTHLTQLVQEGVLSKSQVAPSLQTTSPREYVQRLTRGSDSNVIRYAVANEITCLSILKELRDQRSGACAELIFELPSTKGIYERKPEYLMSILIKRGEAAAVDFIKDTLWMLLQGDVELLAKEYVKLCRTLTEFAAEAGEKKEAKEWAEYTLRLNANYLRRYVDQHLPWKPILVRALELYSQ